MCLLHSRQNDLFVSRLIFFQTISPKINLLYNTCQEAFGSYYEETTTCAEEEVEDATKLFSLRETGFVTIYCWVCLVFVLTLGWCAFNQRLSPVPGSIQPLLAEEKSHEFVEESASSWKQTGYRAFGRPTAVIGAFIYLIVVITLVGFQFILGSLTILYYIQQGAIAWFEPVFEDEIQVLKVHEITWAVAFVFTLLLKWPVSIRFLFLRRSKLENASHVAVQTPVKEVRQAEQRTDLLELFNNWMVVVGGCFKSVMRCIFSDISLPASGDY